jgi:glycosyltransferase involved in cell wall biosynthesis
MEAMAAGCLVIGSSTSPVEEVIVNGVNGLLADFHSPSDIARTVVNALSAGSAYDALRVAARGIVQDRYALDDCLARQKQLVNRLSG